MLRLLFIAIVLAEALAAPNNNEAHLLGKLKQGLQEAHNTRAFPLYLNETLKQLQLPHFFRNNDPVAYELEAETVCSTCYLAANFLITERHFGVSEDVIAVEATTFCSLLGIESYDICLGVIKLNIPIFAHLVDTNKDLKGERICDIILQNSGCNSTTFEWTIEVPEGKTVTKKQQSNPESTFNVLQISDFHYDPLYTPGKLKNCGGPLCCQSDAADGNVANGTACGYWSEYQSADASEALVDESIRKAKEFDFDYVYFTGDIVSHRVWSTSVENNTRDMKLIFRKMKRAFPGKPIYPILGNHEPTPLNEYSIGDALDPALSTQWLYRLIVSEFSQWLPKSAKRDLMKGGFYSVSPRAGFRIIALNSNVAYTMNWWLAQNDTDPFGQLEWLAKTLKQAEDNNEIVHILSHIPSGKSDLMSVWSREYRKLIERFANTIAAQFNGHTHKDQFMVYYSSSNASEVVNVAINGASVICDKANPSFKIINVDNDNYDVIDTQMWTFNLTEANLSPDKTPNWYQLYSFRESFGMKSLAPTEFAELLPRMAANHDLLYDYHIFRFRNSDVAVSNGCDDGCKKNYLCEMVTSQVGDSTQCDLITELYDKNLANIE